ncbi:MAG: DNA repair protein RecO [Planctomycetaceae bacterium]|jgi:DNA repair protein RecO (recombination protein O)|nr:DNA repair protein RecO [Planctomycetaceae bacterium]
MLSADAVVIRTVDFSETSRIVTLYTRPFGKIEALAKGARRLKSPFESSLDILSHVAVTFIPKRGDALDLLTESKLIRRFHIMPKNLSGVLGSFYVAELLDLFIEPEDPMPALYDLAVKALHLLEECSFVMRTLIRFEGRLLQMTGHRPMLGHCIGCGLPLEYKSADYVTFGLSDGGVLCPLCAPGYRQTIRMAAETLKKWEILINPADRTEEWKKTSIRKETLREIRGTLNQYICHLLGKKPRLYDWWKIMAKND